MRLFGKKTGALEPHMHPIEFSQVRAILEALQARNVLEWGCGGSTARILRDSPFIERFVAIEHHALWSQRVREAVTDPRLDLHFIPPDEPLAAPNPSQAERIAWNARAEVEPDLMRSYVTRPRALGVTFDFVLVDGRARNLCVVVGWEVLRSGGVLVMHDAQRPDYRQALLELPRTTWLEPFRQGQIAVARKP